MPDWQKDSQICRNRHFKLWDYSPSLQRLLIRSPMTTDWPKNVDIVFYGVEMVDLPSNLGKILNIDEQMDGELTLYKIATESDLYGIKALNYSVSESITDIFDSPLSTL